MLIYLLPIEKPLPLLIPRGSSHDLVSNLLPLEWKGDARDEVGAKINEEDGQCPERQGDPGNNKEQKGRHLSHIADECECNCLLDVVEDYSACVIVVIIGNLYDIVIYVIS